MEPITINRKESRLRDAQYERSGIDLDEEEW